MGYKIKFIKTKSRMEDSEAERKREWESYYNGYRVSVQDEKVLKTDHADSSRIL